MVIQGVIRPPPEIRAVADKTASYVAKNGRAFEARILGSGKGKTPKFAFLHQSSPFHAYYEERIRFYENGGEDKKEDEEKKSDEGGDKAKGESQKDGPGEEKKEDKDRKKKDEKSKKSSASLDPVAKALLAQRAKITQARAKFNEEAEKETPKTGEEEEKEEEQPLKRKQLYTPPAPPSLELVNIVAPSSLTIAQVETIQLLAQFTALDGKGGPFFSKLSHREWANPAFAFTQPRHAHFAYFSALVDAYRHIYESWSVGSNAIKNDTIPEMAGNVGRCLELAAYRVEYERDLEEQTKRQQTENGGEAPEVAQIDWHDFVVVETIDFPADEVVETVLPPPPAPKSSIAADNNDLVAAGTDANVGGDMDEYEDEEGETIRVVPSYKPKVMSTKQSYSSDEVIDPITGKSVPIKDMPEHMRIQLLDPKWAEERKKFQEKQKDSNLVSGDMMASNISRFSHQSFGNAGQDLLSGEAGSKRRLEEANRVIREQSQRGVGPTLPQPVQPATGTALPPPPPPQQHGQAHAPDPGLVASTANEPAAKKQRLDDGVQDPRMTASADPSQPPGATIPVDPMADPTPTTDNTEKELMPENEFIETLSKPEVTLQIRIPNDPTQMAWNFYGQTLSLTVDVKSKVKQVKEELSKTHLNGMPANKIQLKGANGFLQNSKSLASLNIGPSANLEMTPKTRGGRR